VSLPSRIAFHPLPLRVALFRALLRRLEWVSFATRLEYDALVRPYYAFCMYYAAALARALAHRTISVIEFGVAGGNGLVNIEHHAEQLERETGSRFEVYGFDLETGLPKPKDHRDMPYMWAEGFYKMDRPRLERRLKRAKLVIGDVAKTVQAFFERHNPAPIGAVLFDLDYYSSTRDALTIFQGPPESHLPRVYCYFDDIASGGLRANNRYVGVLRAIEEFNEANPTKKIAQINGLSTSRAVPASWNERIFVMHDFDHPAYTQFIGNAHQSLPLE
jgi:hypothetical protein